MCLTNAHGDIYIYNHIDDILDLDIFGKTKNRRLEFGNVKLVLFVSFCPPPPPRVGSWIRA